MKIRNFGVVGAGQMGSGIAQVAAKSGLSVVMFDVREKFVKQGLSNITGGLKKGIEKGLLEKEEEASILSRITASTDLNDLGAVDFIVEAVPEKQDLKFQVFRKLDQICAPSVILSTNTSSIPIGRIAAQTTRQDKIIGMHFMNPVPLMKLVEVIRGLATSKETFETTWALAKRLGKTPAESGDYPGFIANRILMPMINEAVFTLYNGVGSREAIDTVMKLGMNHPMGPLALADLIGLDTCLAIMETLYEGFKDPKYRPCPLLRKYVEAGWLGKKTGRGFYEYN